MEISLERHLVAKVNTCTTSKKSRNHAITKLKKITGEWWGIFLLQRKHWDEEGRKWRTHGRSWKSDEWSNILGISDEKDGEMNFFALHGL